MCRSRASLSAFLFAKQTNWRIKPSQGSLGIGKTWHFEPYQQQPPLAFETMIEGGTVFDKSRFDVSSEGCRLLYCTFVSYVIRGLRERKTSCTAEILPPVGVRMACSQLITDLGWFGSGPHLFRFQNLRNYWRSEFIQG